jgi:Arc/MetJ family transcription regulator
MRVELDASSWAEIMDVSELRSGDRKAVNKAVRVELDEKQQPILSGALTQDMRDALLKRVVRDWSFPFPIPEKDPVSLDKLTLEQEDALNKAIKPHMDLIDGTVDPTRRDTDPTADSAS